MLFLLLVFLHIATMFAAVALTYGPETIILFSFRADNSSALRGILIATRPLARLVPMLFGLGGILGLLAAIVSGYNLLAPWLLIAYAVFIVLTLVGVGLTTPNLEALGAAVADVPDGPLPPAAVAVARSTRFRVAVVLDFVLLAVVIYDMVVKPFS